MKHVRRQQENHGGPGRPAMNTRRPLSTHPGFVPLLGLWGAALGSLVVLVLPLRLIAPAAMVIGLDAAGVGARAILAGWAALMLGGLLVAFARHLKRSARSRQGDSRLAAMPSRVSPIDPVRDLGSETFDAPIAAPDAEIPSYNGAQGAVAPSVVGPSPPAVIDGECRPAPGQTRGPATLPERGHEGGESTAGVRKSDGAVRPRELALAEFAALPGRNAVWVEEPNVPAPATASRESAGQMAAEPARPGLPSAIERLRAVPARQLGLLQMVERFAAALHDHRTATQRRPNLPAAEGLRRDAALAEALAALAELAGTRSGASEGEGEHRRVNAADLKEDRRGAA